MRVNRRKFLGTTAAFLASTSTVPLPSCVTDIGHNVGEMVDRTADLSKGHPRKKRDSTKYVVLHYSAAWRFDVERTLKGLQSPGRSAHYFITRGGRMYNLVPEDLVASHAGVSRWDGTENLNDHSLNDYTLGIEFEGDGRSSFTNEQYMAFQTLYRGGGGIKGRFGIKDKDVLDHSWVAYSAANKGNKKVLLRGRKSDPGFLFSRREAGIIDFPETDTDADKGIVIPAAVPRIVIYPEKHELAVEDECGWGVIEVARYPIAIDKRGPSAIPKGKFFVLSKVPYADSRLFGPEMLFVSANGRSTDFAIHGTPDAYRTNPLTRELMHYAKPDFNDWTYRAVALDNRVMNEVYTHFFKHAPVEVK